MMLKNSEALWGGCPEDLPRGKRWAGCLLRRVLGWHIWNWLPQTETLRVPQYPKASASLKRNGSFLPPSVPSPDTCILLGRQRVILQRAALYVGHRFGALWAPHVFQNALLRWASSVFSESGACEEEKSIIEKSHVNLQYSRERGWCSAPSWLTLPVLKARIGLFSFPTLLRRYSI